MFFDNSSGKKLTIKVLIDALHFEIGELKKKGISHIACDDLLNYLNTFQNNGGVQLSDAELEKYKTDLQKWVQDIKSTHESNLAMFHSVIDAGQNALKAGMALNGGASIATLAFLGHLARIEPDKIDDFSSILITFTVGALIVALTSGLTYLSQWFYANNTSLSLKIGFGLNISCIISMIATYILFGCGIYKAYQAFLNYEISSLSVWL